MYLTAVNDLRISFFSDQNNMNVKDYMHCLLFVFCLFWKHHKTSKKTTDGHETKAYRLRLMQQLSFYCFTIDLTFVQIHIKRIFGDKSHFALIYIDFLKTKLQYIYSCPVIKYRKYIQICHNLPNNMITCFCVMTKNIIILHQINI